MQIRGHRHGLLHPSFPRAASGRAKGSRCPSSRAALSSSPTGECSIMKKVQRNEIAGPELPATLLRSLSLSCSPHPHRPQLRRAGTRRCEGSCPAPPEQSPPREPGPGTELVTKAIRGAERQVCAPMAGHEEGLDNGVRFAPSFSGSATSRSRVLNDLLG